MTNSNPPNQSPSMPQSDIRANVTKLVTDMTVEKTLSEEFLIDKLIEYITNHTNAAVIAAEDKWFQWMINEVGYERARQYKDIAALGVKDGNN